MVFHCSLTMKDKGYGLNGPVIATKGLIEFNFRCGHHIIQYTSSPTDYVANMKTWYCPDPEMLFVPSLIQDIVVNSVSLNTKGKYILSSYNQIAYVWY